MNSVSTKDCTNTTSTVAFVILPIRRDTIRFNFAIMHLRCTAACEITLGHAELVWFNVGNGAAKNVCERVRFLYRWQSKEEWKKCQLRMACAQSWWNTFERTKYFERWASRAKKRRRSDTKRRNRGGSGLEDANIFIRLHFYIQSLFPLWWTKPFSKWEVWCTNWKLSWKSWQEHTASDAGEGSNEKNDGKNNGIEAKMRQVSVCECSREEKNAPEYLIAAF